MSSTTPITSPTAAALPIPILTLQNKITIRPLQSRDKESLSLQGNNRKIWLNLTDRFPHPYTESSAEFWINHCNNPDQYFEARSDHPLVSPEYPYLPSNYAICLLDQPIGVIGLERNPVHTHVVALGYWLGEDHWGKGIATMVASAFLVWTWDAFPWVVRVYADAYGWNESSAKVLRKIGLLPEGRQKLAVCKDGRYGDLVLFGAVREGFAGPLAGGNS